MFYEVKKNRNKMKTLLKVRLSYRFIAERERGCQVPSLGRGIFIM